jgi:hypothetical protein
VAGLEVAVISLGAAVVKSACRVWLGDRPFAGDVTSELVDLFAGRVNGRFDQRKIGRFFDDCTDIVARRLVTLLDVEFGGVPPYEREAAVLAVRDTFAAPRWATRHCSRPTWTPGWSSGSCVPPPGWCCGTRC